jgi:hypothetical protein
VVPVSDSVVFSCSDSVVIVDVRVDIDVAVVVLEDVAV